MYWRLGNREFEAGKGEGNRAALKALVEAGETPGLLAYVAGEPAGWIAIAPREAYPRLARSRILKPVDDQPVWSITCFFVGRPFRRRGLTLQLLRAAVEFAAARDARIVEGYPVDTAGARTPDPFAYTGLASAFLKAGFVEVARRSEKRPIMRYTVAPME